MRLMRKMTRPNWMSLALVLALLFPVITRAADPKPQTRAHGSRVEVPPERVKVDDGDTVTIEWADGDVENVRILGIDTPETQHVPHNLPFDQPFGREAAGFAKGAFAVATKIELLRAPTKDPFDRSLGYLFLNGRNYSELVLRARLAEESVTRYGDNGLPEEAAACLAAAREAGPVPFESPGAYRKRMREVTEWMRAHGLLPPLEEN
jgi:endonuclease YncB( thermonuclease family)